MSDSNFNVIMYDPNKLTSITRADIWVRVNFLDCYERWCIEHPNEEIGAFAVTALSEDYPRFISDERRAPAIPQEPITAVNRFISLYKEIKNNGWLNVPPIEARMEKDSAILIDGAHRLSIALFLYMKEVPVKIIHSTLNPLNYSEFLTKYYGYPAERVLYIKHLISQLGRDYKPGSSREEGLSYHPLPFPEFADIKSVQGARVAQKFNMILNGFNEKLSWQPSGDSVVLDIGCSTGYFCFRFSEVAGKVIGIEHDNIAVEIAKELSGLYRRNIEFKCIEVKDSSFLKNIGKIDVTLILGVFHWISHAIGLFKAVNIIDEISKQTKYLVFETSGISEGRVRVPEIENEQELLEYILKHSHFNSYKKVGEALSPIDKSRGIYIFYTK